MNLYELFSLYYESNKINASSFFFKASYIVWHKVTLLCSDTLIVKKMSIIVNCLHCNVAWLVKVT